MERSKAVMKTKEVPTAHRYPAKHNNNKHMTVFYKIWKKYNEIQLTKNKMDLNNRKMEKPHLEDDGDHASPGRRCLTWKTMVTMPHLEDAGDDASPGRRW